VARETLRDMPWMLTCFGNTLFRTLLNMPWMLTCFGNGFRGELGSSLARRAEAIFAIFAQNRLQARENVTDK
jgi:hypothetical protein